MCASIRASQWCHQRSASASVVPGTRQSRMRGHCRGKKYIGLCHSSIAQTRRSTSSRCSGTCGVNASIEGSSLKW